MQFKQHLLQHKISYYHEGAGDVIVLLHGFGEDKDIWLNQLAELKKSHQVIVPDLPGTGNSILLEGNDISIETYTHWLFEFINHIISPQHKIILLGHSMGGYITLAYANKYPETLTAFGLIHSTAFADSLEKKEVRKKGIETISEYGAYAFLKNTIPNLFSKQFKITQKEKVEALIAKGKNFTSQALQQYTKAMMNRNNATDILTKTALPVLFVIGTEDIAAPMQDVLQQCHLPKKSYVHVLENVGHMSMIEAPEKLNQILKSFVEDI
jgi:pimeloyl-ACP methyl ester carboxylesterase